MLNFHFKPILKPSWFHWGCSFAESGAHPCSALAGEKMLGLETGFRQAAAIGGWIKGLPFSFLF